MATYIALLHKERDSDFGVSFPDFPGCVTAGRSLEEAQKLAPEALALHVEGMLDDGDALPRPSSLDDVQKLPEARGAVILLVYLADPVEPTVRVNITAPASKLRKVDEIAQRLSLSRSELLVDSALAHALADLEGWETRGTTSYKHGVPICVTADPVPENTPKGLQRSVVFWIYALSAESGHPTGQALRFAATRRDAEQLAEEMAKSAVIARGRSARRARA
jgi:predicted RNase H-like HicB family nuclease